ncbi:SGNH/GDSL hydrolase family protein [Novosphingobium sp.]|uniref:SGNH/GDSL hydrolase family protein n=1 Tax=Novosphingobium sp. TaxID=1874826 RepID=UPI00261B3767|nr:SGNH/GDSL hydrolase family protein [Novosphingobium sp.]
MTLDPMMPRKVLFIGDSITDCDRLRPVGEGVMGTPLGTGYVALVAALLTARRPTHRQRIVNMGVSGDTVRGLAARWQSDVLAIAPDHVVIMIGINDVWRAFSRTNWGDWQIGPEEYRETLTRLVTETRAAGIGVSVAGPFFIEPDRTEPMRARMDAYAAIASGVAAEQGLGFIDVQAAFDHVLEALHPMALAPDRVHPALAGHMIIAEAVIAGLFGAL